MPWCPLAETAGCTSNPDVGGALRRTERGHLLVTGAPEHKQAVLRMGCFNASSLLVWARALAARSNTDAGEGLGLTEGDALLVDKLPEVHFLLLTCLLIVHLALQAPPPVDLQHPRPWYVQPRYTAGTCFKAVHRWQCSSSVNTVARHAVQLLCEYSGQTCEAYLRHRRNQGLRMHGYSQHLALSGEGVSLSA